MSRWTWLFGGLAALVPLTACSSNGGSEAATKPPPSTTASAPAASSTTVEIKTFAFGPKELRVPVGTAVTWTNKDAILHTVTSGTREADAQGQPVDVKKDGQFDAQLDGVGSSTTNTFTKAGTVTYFCDRHPGMDATVVVG